MSARLTTLLLTALGAVVLASGCGGGGGDSASSSSAVSPESSSESATAPPSSTSTSGEAGPTISKTKFVSKAEAICEEGRGAVVSYKAPSSVKESETYDDAVESAFIPAFTEVADQIEALGAPPGDEASIEAFLSALRQEISALEGHSGSFSSLSDIEKEFKGSARLARQYGIESCAYYFE